MMTNIEWLNDPKWHSMDEKVYEFLVNTNSSLSLIFILVFAAKRYHILLWKR